MQAFTKEELNELFPNFINTGRLSLEELKKVTPEMRTTINLLNKEIHKNIYRTGGLLMAHPYNKNIHVLALASYNPGTISISSDELVAALRGIGWQLAFPVVLAENSVYGFLMDLDTYEVPGYRVGAPNTLKKIVREMLTTPLDILIRKMFDLKNKQGAAADYAETYGNYLRLFLSLEHQMLCDGLVYNGVFTFGTMTVYDEHTISGTSLEQQMKFIPEGFQELLYTRKVLMETHHLFGMEKFLQDPALQEDFESTIDSYVKEISGKDFQAVVEDHFGKSNFHMERVRKIMDCFLNEKNRFLFRMMTALYC